MNETVNLTRDDIEAAMRELAEGLRQRWQPIETAPKDGEDILVWGPMLGHHVVSYDDEWGDPDFPWHTLDGPSYKRDGFLCWKPLDTPETE